MPIKMTKNYNPGDNDPEAKDGYPFCQIVTFHQNALTFGVFIEYAFGYCTGDYLEKFERGKGSPIKVLECAPAKVAELWSKPPEEGESVGAAMRRLTYTHLIESGAVDGSIMNNPPLPPEEAKPETPVETAPELDTSAEAVPEAEAAAEAAPEAKSPAEETPAPAEGTASEQPVESASEAPAEDAPAEPVPSPS